MDKIGSKKILKQEELIRDELSSHDAGDQIAVNTSVHDLLKACGGYRSYQKSSHSNFTRLKSMSLISSNNRRSSSSGQLSD